MIEAAAGGRRFGVATTTPELAAAIEGRARDLKLLPQCAGIRADPGRSAGAHWPIRCACTSSSQKRLGGRSMRITRKR